MRVLLMLALLAAAGGCIRQAEPQTLPAAGPQAAPEAQPVVAEWDGRIALSELGPLAHHRDTEPLVADVQREGLVFDITEPPRGFRVELAWAGGQGEMLIMVSTPHKDGKGFEYFTDWSSEPAQCLLIPPDEVVPGRWQIMAHSRGVMQADFVFKVTTVGGSAAILEGEPHSSAEAAETSEKDELPCEGVQA